MGRVRAERRAMGLGDWGRQIVVLNMEVRVSVGKKVGSGCDL